MLFPFPCSHFRSSFRATSDYSPNNHPLGHRQHLISVGWGHCPSPSKAQTSQPTSSTHYDLRAVSDGTLLQRPVSPFPCIAVPRLLLMAPCTWSAWSLQSSCAILSCHNPTFSRGHPVQPTLATLISERPEYFVYTVFTMFWHSAILNIFSLLEINFSKKCFVLVSFAPNRMLYMWKISRKCFLNE